jgi:hypothetical protein
MKPWHDCPKCPHCGGTVAMPIRAARDGWNHRADVEKDNLACPACGSGWVGTPEEVAQAERAQLAWEAKERAEMWNERTGWYAAARAEAR